MKNQTSYARSALLAAALGLVAALGATPALAQNNGTPAPKILVIDRSAILRASKVGQDIARQVQAYTQSAEKEFKGEADALRKEGAALQQQLAILAPDVKQRKARDYQNKEAALQKKVDARQQQIQYSILVARQKVEQALGPVLQGIMNERGANLLLDRQAVVLGTIDVDITRLAVQRLDQKMPSTKFTLVSPPPQQQAPQQ